MNTKMHKLIPLAGAMAALLLLSACATHIKSNIQTNPPPAEPLMNFTAYEMQPATLAPAFATQGPNQKALVKIQENLSAGMNPTLANWNAAGAAKGGAKRTLLIVPLVKEIKFVGGASRFWVGAMAGSSAVILDVTITEKETGKVIATPEFYDVGKAMSGGWSMGTTDNLMLVNIANRVTEYLIKNYSTAVGGPSGAP